MKIISLLKKGILRFQIPLLLLGVISLAYGWQIGHLGFYWDDWVFIGRYQSMGILNTIFYGGTRQLGVYALMPGFLLAGDSPLIWHVYSLLLRWLVVMLFWWVLNKLWPSQKTAVTLMAALFAVYPAFSQQSISVVYSLQFADYAVFLLSLGLMINSIRSPSRRWFWFVFALFAQSLHLFIVEYFVGLELIRPLVIYFLAENKPGWIRLKRTFLYYLPYLCILILYAFWRSGVFGGGFADYGYKTITSFWLADPKIALVEIIEYGLKDILVLLVQTWYATLSPSIIDFSQPYNFFSMIVAGLAGFGLYTVVMASGFDQVIPEDSDEKKSLTQAAILGLFAVIVSFIPAWFVRRHIYEPGNFGDRFALAGLFGASILLVVLFRFLAGRNGKFQLMAVIFIGLAIGIQIRFENNYRWDWERQLRTYWQLYWRAPALKPGTVVIGFNAISPTTVNYVGAFAINDLYLPGKLTSSPPVWFVNYPKTPISANMDKFLTGNWVYVDQFDNISAPVRPDNSLAIDYSEGRCLKVISSDDRVNPDFPDGYRTVINISSPGLILGESTLIPSRRIFGPAPTPSWCYYFEKADLARQEGQWDEVLKLKEKADKAGMEPLSSFELFPFIEAYAMRSDWVHAQKLSLAAYKAMPKTSAGLCLIWKRVGTTSPAGFSAAFQNISGQIGCH